MSGKGMKKIRKHMKKELQGKCRVEAKWRFPWSIDPHFIVKPFKFILLNKFAVKIPFLKLVMPRKGWNEIKKFPAGQFRFQFRFVREAVIQGNTVTLNKG